jgi:hypothetical protein
MHREKRALYYVGRALHAGLQTRLQERFWKVELIEPGIVPKVTRRRVSAGILDFSSLEFPADLRYLHALLANSLTGWVALGHREDLEDAIVRGLIRDYCFDYITLPTLDDRLVDAVGHAYGMVALQVDVLSDATDSPPEGEMVGSCEAMRSLFRSIRKVAMTDAGVYFGRVRHGQGTDCSCHSRTFCSAKTAVRRNQLRCHSCASIAIRVVRL